MERKVIKRDLLNKEEFYTKDAKNVHRLDFHKFKYHKDFYPLNFFITERSAAGKTFNSKLHILAEFEKTGKPALWLKNRQKQVKLTAQKFFHDMRKPSTPIEFNKLVEGHKIKGSEDTGYMWVNKKGEIVAFIISLFSIADFKDSRPDYSCIIVDEFNEKVGGFDWMDKFNTLMGNLIDSQDRESILNDDRQLFVFGNNLTMNHPLLVKLQLDITITTEITEISLDNDNWIRIFQPKLTPDQKKFIEEVHKGGFIYNTLSQTGGLDHVFFNESNYDTINNVKQFDNNGEFLYTIKTRNANIEVYKIKIKYLSSDYAGFHFVGYPLKEKVKKDRGRYFILNNYDLIEGATYNKSVKGFIREIIAQSTADMLGEKISRYYYSNNFTREELIHAAKN